jgi:hypothetical protein
MDEGCRDENASAEVSGDEEEAMWNWKFRKPSNDDWERAGGDAEEEDEE